MAIEPFIAFVKEFLPQNIAKKKLYRIQRNFVTKVYYYYHQLLAIKLQAYI